ALVVGYYSPGRVLKVRIAGRSRDADVLRTGVLMVIPRFADGHERAGWANHGLDLEVVHQRAIYRSARPRGRCVGQSSGMVADVRQLIAQAIQFHIRHDAEPPGHAPTGIDGWPAGPQ